MAKPEELASCKVLQLLDLPMKTMVYWNYSVAIGWYVSVLGHSYQVVMTDELLVDYLVPIEVETSKAGA